MHHRRLFLMTLFTLASAAAAKSCKRCYHPLGRSSRILPNTNTFRNNASRPTTTHHMHPLHTNNNNNNNNVNRNHRTSSLPSASAFQSHNRFFSSKPQPAAPAAAVAVAAPSPSLSSLIALHSSPNAKSNIITKSDAEPWHQKISPSENYVLTFAGRSRAGGASSEAGSGMVLFDADERGAGEIWHGHQKLDGGAVSPNEADYLSLIAGLECARSLGAKRLTARGSNALLVKQMLGRNKVNKPSLKEYHGKAVSLGEGFDFFEVKMIDGKANKRAIELAKEAMELETTEEDDVVIASFEPPADLMAEATRFEPPMDIMAELTKEAMTMDLTATTAADDNRVVVVEPSTNDRMTPDNKAKRDFKDFSPAESTTMNTNKQRSISQSAEPPSFLMAELANMVNLASDKVGPSDIRMAPQDKATSNVEGFSPAVETTTNTNKENTTSQSSSNTPTTTTSKNNNNNNIISPEKTYVLRFDGGSRGNPGTAGAGMVLYDAIDGSELWSASHYIGSSNTNNEAEYMGMITGLQCARALGVENIVVQGDSQLILRQVEGRYKVNSANLKPYHREAVALKEEFGSFEMSHIERARNGRADALANEAMDTRSSRGFDVS